MDKIEEQIIKRDIEEEMRTAYIDYEIGRASCRERV